eukprot:2076033-Lingulodinium_polyedra.AAC.1
MCASVRAAFSIVPFSADLLMVCADAFESAWQRRAAVRNLRNRARCAQGSVSARAVRVCAKCNRRGP